MYRHILIATDGSELAEKAVKQGIALAKNLKAPVSVVTVTEKWSAFDMARDARQGAQNPITRYEEMAVTAARNVLERAAQVPSRKTSPASWSMCRTNIRQRASSRPPRTKVAI
jgi:nucleotide-binding universal stress UspA family protein